MVCKKIRKLFVNAVTKKIELSSVNLSDFIDVALKIIFGEPLINNKLRYKRSVNILGLLCNGKLCNNLFGCKCETYTDTGSNNL